MRPQPMTVHVVLDRLRTRAGVSVRMLCSFALVSGMFAGCVSSEKYEAEKARALNFQRLLAQEEKRTGEINVKFQETQRELSALESKNRDLNSELEAMRDQFSRTQDEISRLRDGTVDSPSADDLTLSEPSISEFGLEDIEFKDSDFDDLTADTSPLSTDDTGDLALSSGSGQHHTVTKGDTLFSISRMYTVTVQDIKGWNGLTSNLIKPGQKLVVSRP